MESEALGYKIRTFRIRAGMSQLDLELEIGISSGSISRIESGATNPTKETILKIVEVLKLNPNEAASLFDLNITDEIIKSLSLSRSINSVSELDELFQVTVNEISYKLSLLSAVIFTVKGDRVFSQSATQTQVNLVSLKLIGKPFNRLNVSLETDKENLIVKTVLNDKEYQVDDLYQVTRGAIPKILTKVLTSLSKFHSGLTFPIRGSKGTVLGALFVGRTYPSTYASEKIILRELSKHIALTMERFTDD